MKVIIFDGAFGTYYHSKSLRNEQCETANINDQETTYQIHKEYVDAGIDAVKTNTFGANRINYPDVSIRNTIIKNGFDLAILAVKGTNTRVFADIGYFDVDKKEESNEISEQEEYISIAGQFLKAGATDFIFETLAEYEPILPAVEFIKKMNPKATVIVSFAVSQDGYTRKGLYYKTLLRQAVQNPDIDVCGLNCICGPSHIYQLLNKIDRNQKPICAMPNSGYPTTLNGRTIFQDNAKYFAEKLNELRKLGIEYLGGCCGTSPEHMKQAIKLIRDPSQELLQDNIPLDSYENPEEKSISRTNLFKDKLSSGKPVIAVELDPPMDTDVSFLLSAAQKAKDAGADIITIADSPLARTRADSMLLASKVKREIGIDVLPHLSCRDRNHIGLKGSILGASIENINNMLIVTGDPIAQTDRGEMKGVFSYNSFQLISFVKSLNEEVIQQTPINIAAALNVNSSQFNSELKRAQNKIDKGAKLFLTQPLFSEESIQNAINAKDTLSTKILFGIMPVVSYKNAMFLNNEVSGIHIPEEFVNQLSEKTPQAVAELSLRFCMDIVRKTIKHADGYYLMTPLKKIDMVCELVKRITEIYMETK